MLIFDPQAIIPTFRPAALSFRGPISAARDAAHAGSAVILSMSW